MKAEVKPPILSYAASASAASLPQTVKPDTVPPRDNYNHQDPDRLSLSSRQGPPRLDPNWHIDRPRPLKFISANASLVVIEGKPGQGKTALAAEIFERCETARIWLSLDSSVQHLAAFIERILTELRPDKAISGNLNALVEQLTDALVEYDEPITFVIDNFDQLEENKPAHNALIQLIDVASANIRFVLCSRVAITPLERRLAGHEGVLIDNELLAFDVEETLRLNQAALPLDTERAIAAWQHCGGWPILVNAARQSLLKHRERTADESILTDNLRWGYDLLLQSLTPAEQAALCRFSFYRVIDRRLVSTPEDYSALSRCGDFFIQTDPLNHHLDESFRRYLATLREDRLSEDDIKSLFETSIEQSLSSSSYIEVLDSLAQLGDVSRLDEFLHQHGNQIRPEDWSEALELCQKIEPEAIENHPSYALNLGRWLIEPSPNQAEKTLIEARRQFVNRQDVLGELLALTYYFEYKLNIGRASHLVDLYPRFRELSDSVGQDLEPIDQIAMQIQMAGVEIYGIGNTEAANAALDAAQLLLVDFNLPDDETMVHAFRSVDHLLNGRIDAARTTIEKLSGFGEPAREDTRITVAFMYANFLPVIGETESLKYFINDAMEHLRSDVLEQRQTGGFLRLVQAQFFLFAGQYEDALTLLTQAANTHVFIADGDVREQGHIVTALTYASLGNHRAARRHLQQFEHYSVTPAYRYRQMLNQAMTYVYLEDWPDADRILHELTDAVVDGEDNEYSGTACGIYAYALDQRGDAESADPYIRRWAEAVAQRGSSTVLTVGNTRHCFAYLIKAALQVIDDTTPFLARIGQLRNDFPDLSLSSNHELIPGLKITTGPQLELCLNDEPLNLTKSQKRLLLIIALSPGQKISTHAILEKIWPEEEGAENRLYTLTSRTRKVFAKAGVELDDYLQTTPGELALTNTHLDISRFTHLLSASENYSRNGFNSLSRLIRFTALDSWSGLIDPALESLIDVDEAHRHAVLTYQRACVQLARAESLSKLNEAKLLQHLTGLFDAEPENLSIASAVCRLHNRSGDGAGVYFAQQQFAKGLTALDLPEESYQAQMIEFETMSDLSSQTR